MRLSAALLPCLLAVLAAPARAVSVMTVEGGDGDEGVVGVGKETEEGFWAEAELDRHRPYVNQAVVLTLRGYSPQPPIGTQWGRPEAVGFIVGKIPAPNYEERDIGGRHYYIVQSQTIVYPTSLRSRTIGPALVRIQAGGTVQKGLHTRWHELKTSPVGLRPKPFPKRGRPRGFEGAVGKFKISSSIDRKRLSVGEVVVLTVRVKGLGNVARLGSLDVPRTQEFKVSSPQFSHKFDPGVHDLSGVGTYRVPFSPLKEGRLRVPSVAFHYFDPNREAYETLRTRRRRITVLPGKPTVGSQLAKLKDKGSEAAAQGWEQLLENLPYAKILAAAGGGAVVVSVLALFIRSRLKASEAAARSESARQEALQRLRKCMSESDAQRGMKLLAETPARYAADKLGGSPVTLSPAEAYDRLAERYKEMSWDALADFRKVWEEIRKSRDDVQPADVRILALRLKEVLNKLEG